MRHSLVTIAVGLGVVAGAYAQTAESLRTKAKAQGGEASFRLIQDYSALPVPELAQRSQVIVRGHVRAVQPHLTADESEVVTDITVTPAQVIKQDVPVTAAAKPQLLQPIVVRHVGGTVVEDGLRMSTFTNAFPIGEEFRVGEEVILFLTYHEPQNIFLLTDGPFAAFRIREASVHRLTKESQHYFTDNSPQPIAAFLADVQRNARK
jgi:hypothetical protein